MSRTTRVHRMSIAIHEQIRPAQTLLPTVPHRIVAECDRLTRLIEKARGRGFPGAAARLSGHLAGAYESLSKQAAIAHRSLTAAQPATTRLVDIHADLVALMAEFEDVAFDRKHGCIRMWTDCIVLEEIDLGRFQIALDYRCLGEPGCYEVIAEAPNPASEHGGTTHPHVQNGNLCEGEGKTAIRSALNECRLLDFFLIVNQVLHNYNADSAFTRLEDWNGAECPGCGYSVHTDDECTCEACSTTSCFECTTGCTSCSDRYCHGCVRTCAACDDSVCPACLANCSTCEETHCKGCLINDKCESCEEEEITEENSEAPAPNDPVHTVFMGQAAVPA